MRQGEEEAVAARATGVTSWAAVVGEAAAEVVQEEMAEEGA